MSLLDRVLRTGEGKYLKVLRGLTDEVLATRAGFAGADDASLRARADELRGRLAAGASVDELVVEALAVACEASPRVLGLDPYPEQVMGALAVHLGWVAEMRTGEGKTLAAALSCFGHALSGRGVHVVTANEYLARRDAEIVGRLHRSLGVSVGVAVPTRHTAPNARAAQYRSDIVYGTVTEMGFDHLRDHLVADLSGRVQRGHYFAVVDEADSLLIDEARTPLIISGAAAGGNELYVRFAQLVSDMRAGVHFELDEADREVWPTPAGVKAAERALGVKNLYEDPNLVHHLHSALIAHAVYRRDRDYLVSDGEVQIVDQYTGRVLAGRRWSDGIHQAIEAKEGVAVQSRDRTLATITIQSYMGLYERRGGMTGTAQSDAAEFASTYGMQVVQIPTHRPMVRRDHEDLVYRTAKEKNAHLVAEVDRRHRLGQPLLIGTTSVVKSEQVSALLTAKGVEHRVLNASAHEQEATVIAQAGRLGAVTVATNMAGRGVDVLLGGNPDLLAADELLAEGGSSLALLDDFELPVPFEEMPEDERAGLLASRARLEQLRAAWKQRCDADAERVRAVGGLCVIGTERHDSRRIDDQLRGRAGRQGDPGETLFLLSLEDDLMRMFAVGTLQWAMSRAMPAGQPLTARSVSKAVARSQQTAESRNAEMRSKVVEYDEVLDTQRVTYYALRERLLAVEPLDVIRDRFGDVAVDVLVRTAVAGVVEGRVPSVDRLATAVAEVFGQPDMAVIESFRAAFDWEVLADELGTSLNYDDAAAAVQAQDVETQDVETQDVAHRDFQEFGVEAVPSADVDAETGDPADAFDATDDEYLDDEALPFVADAVVRDKDRSGLADLALADPAVAVAASAIAEAAWVRRGEGLNDNVLVSVSRHVALQVLDARWVELLEAMEELRDGARLRAVGGFDPLVVWRTEGHQMFAEMLAGFDESFVRTFVGATVTLQPSPSPFSGAPKPLPQIGVPTPADAGNGPVDA